MTLTHTPPREAVRRGHDARFPENGSNGSHGPHGGPPPLDPGVWQRILTTVRMHHPTLNRVWFDQMTPRQLTHGVIHHAVSTAAPLVVCQTPWQQWFTAAAQAVTNRLLAV